MSKTTPGRPRVWDKNLESVLKGLMVSRDNWKDITEEINRVLKTDYTVSGIKSAAYRRGITLGNIDEALTDSEKINKEFGMTSESSIPKYNVDTEEEWVPIWMLGDMHIAHNLFDEKLFTKHLEWAKENNAYIIGLGDWLECAVPSHLPQTVFSQMFSPEDQADYILKMLYDFKGRVILGVDGNHEHRITNLSSLKVLGAPLRELGALHLPGGGPIDIKVNNQSYSFVIKHGQSFAKDSRREVKEWGEIFPEADVVALGHNHALEAFPNREYFVIKDGVQIQKKQIGLRCGHYLKYGGYVVRRPYKPMQGGSVVVWLNAQEHKLEVSTTGSNRSIV